MKDERPELALIAFSAELGLALVVTVNLEVSFISFDLLDEQN